jgi:predicted P-loop ATPase
MSAKAIAYGLDLNDRNQPLSTLVNAVTVLEQDPLFAQWHYDEFKDRIIITNSEAREIRGDDVTRTRHYLQDALGMTRITKADVKDAIEMVAWQRKRHCVRALLDTVTWDERPRVDRWLMTYLGARPSDAQPEDYLVAAGRNCLLSLVARVDRPGCQVDTMLVLEGPQGLGKSSALRILGGEHYRVALESMTNKDFLQALRGAWVMEIAELSSTSKADVERIKVIISTPSDPYRPSYGAYTLTYPRQCIFIGSTNRDDYLMDETGGRRFNPVRCGLVTLDTLAVDRLQLASEARVRVAAGETWWEMPLSATEVQDSRRADDAWTATVSDYLTGKPNITITEVLTGALKFKESDIYDPEAKRIGRILRGLAWERKTIRRDGKPVQGWKPQEDLD